MYTEEQVKQYAELLSFTSEADLYELFAGEDRGLAEKVAKFHIEATLLDAVQAIVKQGIDKVTYLSIRDHLINVVFNGDADRIELEKKLDEYLPILVRKKLLNKKLKLTKLGKYVVAAKKVAFHGHDQMSEEMH